ncbi:MAG: phosphate signaling complex protein PhoU [Hyphomicrobiales bacterium]|nr:phosphate signaling complex protein PhoU [Hyphomicrobiales bacterium]MCY4048340.1 phosphate signaling complex protein PhoU [Hyphomicrobiales bacterium]MCY4053889.1 phosphate signaling complex protein PhoU [Hyphomicrobiales bacterium]
MEKRTDHIVKSYDDELDQIDHIIAEMGVLAARQLEDAIQALVKEDTALAQKVVLGDAAIDALENEVDALAVRVLALRQPMALDLRRVVAAMKIGGSLERIGDYARNIANRSQVVTALPGEYGGIRVIERMGGIVGEMIHGVLEAYRDANVERAEAIRLRDEAVDQLNNSLFRELLTYMMETPSNITLSMHLLFIAKNLERIGDHVTNVAEHVHVMVTGESLESERPKSDHSSQIISEKP